MKNTPTILKILQPKTLAQYMQYKTNHVRDVLYGRRNKTHKFSVAYIQAIDKIIQELHKMQEKERKDLIQNTEKQL